MIHFTENPLCTSLYRLPYQAMITEINDLVQSDRLTEAMDKVREVALKDLFFFMHFVLQIDPINHPWLLQRIYEVQDNNSNTMDLWSREHWKSTIITYGLNLWDATKNPEQRIGIFSHTRGIAKAFLRKIKHTCEANPNLPNFFPEVFWQNPKTDAPKWSEDDGLILKRQGVFQEATFEAWGVVDGMPTGKHFTVLNYDDLVTEESVSTADQIDKVAKCFGLSLNLGEMSGKKRIIGTYYHFRDLYSTQKDTGVWDLRIRVATEDGTENGKPVLLTPEQLKEKRQLMGPYVFACQILLNPVADENQVFKPEWVRYYKELPAPIRLYGFVDPANSKKIKSTGSDYTVIAIIGLDSADNYFLVDLIRDRLTLTQRWTAIRNIYQKWLKKGNRIVQFWYEQYGMVSDIEHFEHMQEEEGVYFTIEELGGKLAKEDRIKKLQPVFENGNFYLPRELTYLGRDLIQDFLNQEYSVFPYAVHDDMLDAISRVMDRNVKAFRPFGGWDSDSGSKKDNLLFGKFGQSGWAQRKARSQYAYS